jgi:MFS family permease
VRRPGAGIAAALLMNLALGALYCFSVFVAPLEAALAAPRAEISAVFATAVACFTAGMVLAPYLYRLAAAPTHLIGCAGLSIAGLVLSSQADDVPALLVGYGLLFGFGSGYAYSITLQLIALAVPRRRGLAIGLGVGGFAVGSILLAPLFARTIAAYGTHATFAGMAVMIAVAAALSGALMRLSGLALPDPRGPAAGGAPGLARIFPLLWLGFLMGAFAGVMSIGHAAGIVAAQGGNLALAVTGTIAINVGNAGGRIAAGALCDRYAPPRVFGLAHLAAGVGFALLLLAPGPSVALMALGFEGLAYGLASGGYPAALGIYFGVERYGRYLGLLITAWGVAGLSGPWLAGWLYDLSGAYALACVVGLAAAVLGLAISYGVPPPARA